MSIPGSSSALFLAAAAGGGGGYQVERSLRFNSSDSGFLSRTPASAGNRRTWTWSGWVKRAALDNPNFLTLFNCRTDASNYSSLFTWRNAENDLGFLDVSGGTSRIRVVTSQVFRDLSAWYHIVCAVDTTAATSTDRVKLYVNGVFVSALSSTTYGSQNIDTLINSTNEHHIGRFDTFYSSAYLADIHFIDGQALTPSSFTEVSATTGQLIPKKYTGTFGTNGFWLQFADNSNNTATTLGKDTSGNGNNWTPNNFSVSTATATYTPTSNTNLFGMTWAQVFNSSNTAGVYSLDNTTATGTLALSKPYSSSVELLCCSTNGSAPIYANGVAVTSPPTGNNISSAEWRTVLSGSGTLTSVAVQSDGAQRGILFQIRVDGVQLVNISPAGNDSLVDTPTSYGVDDGLGGSVRGNYATLNPLDYGSRSTSTFANGNLDVSNTNGASADSLYRGTIGVSNGKWYFEIMFTTMYATEAWVGIAKGADSFTLKTSSNPYYNGSLVNYLYRANGNKETNSGSATAYGATWTTNDVIGVALDLDAGSLTFYKNGSSQGSAFTGIAGTWFPCILNGGGNSALVVNFGQRPFAYTAPSGFKALCDTNLPAPVVAKPETVFQVIRYTGNGSTQTIPNVNTVPTTLGFSPGFVWLKNRSAGDYHRLNDIIRDANRHLFSNTTDAEVVNDANGYLSAFTSDGFSLTSGTGVNASGNAYVAWTWDAGSSTVTNTAGSITSSVRANASAGFSIVTYTGTGANASVGHGLGVAPSLIIIKARTQAVARNWAVYHSSIGATKILELSTTNAAQTVNFWQDTAPTSTVFTLSSQGDVNASTYNYVAYCFAPVIGYSAMSSFVGNGSSDGVFQWCGFRPRFVMLKSATSATNWFVHDSARSSYNAARELLFPNLSNAEDSSNNYIDLLSNGFKLRFTNTDYNTSGQTYIWAAWAESPFQFSRAR